ncbi:MAG TPA: hypothetical protein PKN13_02725 [Accumulibacter sp.]|nr:hypothetical protein [Accumulibacter sp.]HMW16420.1 hypothetical protein [Accumulibacter sp.]HMX21383.1 hypothetical protein [Accumulibacter sp.]HMY06744.1 hypothetical protein [Accumulibacter sp.]HNC16650.1 hypothetical protein [Accumulibacter sp.]
MEGLLLLLGRVIGLGGIFLCLFAGGNRLLGHFYSGGFQIATLMQAGVALVVVACFLLLLALSSRTRR